jgi:spore germination protein YaaH
MNYSNLSQSPNIKYYDSTDSTDNVLWYENSQSIQAKIDLAKMFGINGLSLWRLGVVPDYANPDDGKDIDLDVWQTIINNTK